MSNKKAFLFPGQGSQQSGMGAGLYESNSEVRNLFDQADDILGFGLKNIMFHGSGEELKRTDVTQPAVFVYSYATYIANNPADAIAVAGHSLGEITALVASGAIEYTTGLQLVAARAKAMQYACELAPSTMAAILGLDDQKVKEICTETDGIVVAANFNCPGQVVISGEIAAVEIAAENCKKAGAKRAIILSVGGAFHSPLMQPALEMFSQAVQQASFNTPSIPVFQNVDAKPSLDPESIKRKLLQQLTSPVLWTNTIESLQNNGVEEYVEFGSKVLSGFVKKIHKEALVTSFE